MIAREKISKVRHSVPYNKICEGHLRYEEVRKLNVNQFKLLFLRSVNGERFDDLVDELIGGDK